MTRSCLAAKELKTNDRPILAVRDCDSPYFDLLGTEQDYSRLKKTLVPPDIMKDNIKNKTLRLLQ
jgi:hypothetical protein